MPQISVKKYELFELDKYTNLMHNLGEKGFVPMNMYHIMMAFVAAANSKDYEQKSLWVKKFSHTSDGAAYYKDKVKIVYDAKPLINIQPDVTLVHGALPLTIEQYKDLDGDEMPLKNIKRGPFTKDEIPKHLVWRVLARQDMYLLREFIDVVFKQIKEARREYEEGLTQLARQNKEEAERLSKWSVFTGDEAMGIYLSSLTHEQPLMRAWFLTSVGGLCSAVGGGFLSDGVRLIGLSNEDAAKIKETLEQKVRAA